MPASPTLCPHDTTRTERRTTNRHEFTLIIRHAGSLPPVQNIRSRAHRDASRQPARADAPASL
jgi:hypothetical protein